MELYSPLELDRHSIVDRPKDHGSAPPVERLIELSSWMMVLGTIRVVCMLADYVGAFIEAVRIEPLTIRMVARLAEQIHPVVGLSSAWPLILAIALRRTRWPQLLPAAAATFLILSIGGLIELSAQLSHLRGYGGTVGSFHLTRRAFLHPSITDLTLGTLGATQLFVELATAIRAIVLIARFRGAPDSTDTRQAKARSSRNGRIALYTSFGFLVLMIRLPLWSTYLEVLNNSRFVREFVLKSEGKGDGRPRSGASYSARPTEEERRFQELRQLLAGSAQEVQNGRFTEAKDRYQRVISTIDSLPEDSLPSGRRLIAEALNNLAWLEATCPQTVFRDPRAAVRHARRATVVEPETGNYWNTLGAAHYRAGEWDDAKTALTQSMALRGASGDSFDWFFLALVELKLGQTAEARRLYDKAVVWFQQSLPQDPELYRFQVETAKELGLPEPAAPALASAKAVLPPVVRPGSIRSRVLRRRDAAETLKGSQQ